MRELLLDFFLDHYHQASIDRKDAKTDYFVTKNRRKLCDRHAGVDYNKIFELQANVWA